MSKKKEVYIQFLKEAVLEYDASEFEKGPLLDPIITYDGEGEIETHKDVPSILERYYFKENEDEFEYVDSDPAGEEPERNEIVTGEEADDLAETMDDLEDELLDESIFASLFEEDDLYEDVNPGHNDGGGEAVDSNPDGDYFDIDDDNSDVFENPEGKPFDGTIANREGLMLENAIIDQLISEMEEAEDDAGEDPDNEQAGTDFIDHDKIDDELNEDLDFFYEEDDIDDDEGEEKPEDELKEDLDFFYEEDDVDSDDEEEDELKEDLDFFYEEDDIDDDEGEEKPEDELKEDLDFFYEEDDIDSDDDEGEEKPEDELKEDLDFFYEEDDVDSDDESEDDKEKSKHPKLDVDEQLEEGFPIGPTSSMDNIEEQFRIFQEQIEEDEKIEDEEEKPEDELKEDLDFFYEEDDIDSDDDEGEEKPEDELKEDLDFFYEEDDIDSDDDEGEEKPEDELKEDLDY